MTGSACIRMLNTCDHNNIIIERFPSVRMNAEKGKPSRCVVCCLFTVKELYAQTLKDNRLVEPVKNQTGEGTAAGGGSHRHFGYFDKNNKRLCAV
jgi:hypothetical protein